VRLRGTWGRSGAVSAARARGSEAPRGLGGLGDLQPRPRPRPRGARARAARRESSAGHAQVIALCTALVLLVHAAAHAWGVSRAAWREEGAAAALQGLVLNKAMALGAAGAAPAETLVARLLDSDCPAAAGGLRCGHARWIAPLACVVLGCALYPDAGLAGVIGGCAAPLALLAWQHFAVWMWARGQARARDAGEARLTLAADLIRSFGALKEGTFQGLLPDALAAALDQQIAAASPGWESSAWLAALAVAPLTTAAVAALHHATAGAAPSPVVVSVTLAAAACLAPLLAAAAQGHRAAAGSAPAARRIADFLSAEYKPRPRAPAPPPAPPGAPALAALVTGGIFSWDPPGAADKAKARAASTPPWGLAFQLGAEGSAIDLQARHPAPPRPPPAQRFPPSAAPPCAPPCRRGRLSAPAPQIPRGALVGVVGGARQGKSLLLAALAGRLAPLAGAASAPEHAAVAAPQPVLLPPLPFPPVQSGHVSSIPPY
jgi:hypothetical protein